MVFAILFPNIDPVLVSIGPINIRWYGIAYGFGIVLGFLLIKLINQGEKAENRLSAKFLDDLFVYSTLGIVIGGRAGYALFYNIDWLLTDLPRIFRVWEGGMSFHGGIFGVIAAVWILCRKYKKNFLHVIDMMACVAPIGMFFGRIANFINAELYGRPSDLPWAVVFPGEKFARHPSQLYEALLEGALLFIVLFSLYRYTKIKLYEGMISGVFMIWYSVSRILVECFREPDLHIGFIFHNYTMGQLLTVPMFVIGIVLIWSSYKKI